MIEILTSKVLKFLVKQNAVSVLDVEKYNWMKYGIELTISTIIGICNIFILSILFGDIVKGLIFILVFVPLRQYLGGYHADTYFKCNLTLALCYSSYLILLFFFPEINNEISIVLYVVELVLIVCLFPVENKHKPFKNQKHYIRCKIISIIAFNIYSLIAMLFNIKNMRYGSIIQYSLHIVMILGIIGYLKERRRTNEKVDS